MDWIRRLGKRFGEDRVFADFNKVYNLVDYYYDEDEAYNLIKNISDQYPRKVKTEHWWCLFYMTMVAEERKENSILGKRIKRLGVYNVLFDKYSAKYTARYMRGMNWQDLDDLMYQRGI